jgi:hypothetical protein
LALMLFLMVGCSTAPTAVKTEDLVRDGALRPNSGPNTASTSRAELFRLNPPMQKWIDENLRADTADGRATQ